MNATANVVIIAAIITKDGPSTHDVRHQATLGLLPRSLVTAFMSCMLMSLSVRPAVIGGHAHGFVDAIDGRKGGALVSYGPSVHSRGRRFQS